jgi:O-succinylbenzoic acid--CoA ligase
MKVTYLDNDPVMREKVESFISEWENSDHFTINTSGSTGIPKSIKISKEHAIASAKATGRFLEIKENDRGYLCLSPDTIGGRMMIVRAMVLNLELFVGPVSSNPFYEKTPDYDLVAMVPLQVRTCIDELVELNQIKHLIIGGAPISSSLEKDIIDLEINGYQTFGMTETISHIALRNIIRGDDFYTTLPDVEIDTNEQKQLKITAPHLGVFDLVTNDIVEILSVNSFKWIGRADFVINSGGYKIHPELVEKELSKIINEPLFCAGLDDEELGEKLILCLEGDQKLTKSDFDSLSHKYWIPKEIYFFENFHYTGSNKIDRNKSLNELQHVKKQVL